MKKKKVTTKEAHPSEPVSEEELKLMSEVVRKRRAEHASMAMATYAVRTGCAGESMQTIAKDFIKDLFHLSDFARFNLENAIDHGRDDYEGEKKIDDIEQMRLSVEVDRVKDEGPHLRELSPEVYREEKQPLRRG